MLKISNTLTRKVEEFTPLNLPKVGLYVCGPTVYDYQHIGNFRTMILADLLLRTLLANDFQVKSVRNITDIDDKIIKGATEKNLSIEEFSKNYTKKFFEDASSLNILPADVNPKATEHVEKMIKYISELIKKGFAYVEGDGSVYFDISKYPSYGKLSQIEKRELKTGTRILSDEYTKENIQDFALWKAVKANDPVGYDSPWGLGRPGWHIECSVMSQEYLGDSFDLHVGGVDLLFPHHENEIAQAEAKTGKPFVKYFIHGEMLLVEGGKMSKSLKNFYLLKDLEAKGFEPLAYRYLVLTAHYRDQLNFTWESLQAAQNALNNLREQVREWDEPGKIIKDYLSRFLSHLNDDLNTPQGLALLWEVVKSKITTSEKAATLLEMDKVLGLKLDEFIAKPTEIPKDIQKLIEERERSRIEKDFSKSDKLRSKIKRLGFKIEDTPFGPKLHRR